MDYLLALFALFHLFNITDTLLTYKMVKRGYKRGVLWMWVANFLFGKIVHVLAFDYIMCLSAPLFIYLFQFFWGGETF